jgi:hypothetical protein
MGYNMKQQMATFSNTAAGRLEQHLLTTAICFSLSFVLLFFVTFVFPSIN